MLIFNTYFILNSIKAATKSRYSDFAAAILITLLHEISITITAELGYFALSKLGLKA